MEQALGGSPLVRGVPTLQLMYESIHCPPLSEPGTNRTFKARLCPLLSGTNLTTCSIFARKWQPQSLILNIKPLIRRLEGLTSREKYRRYSSFSKREFFVDNLLVQIHLVIVMIRWTGLVPSEVEFPLPGSLTVLPLTLQALGGSHLAREVPTLQLMYGSTHCPLPSEEGTT